MLQRLESRQRRKRMMARLRSTRRLPVRADVMQKLLEGDAHLERIEERMAETLQRLARVPQPAAGRPGSDPALLVKQMEDPILQRESRFSGFLDAAWIQSETIDVMDNEVQLLRQVAGLPESWPEVGTHQSSPSVSPPPRSVRKPDSILGSDASAAADQNREAPLDPNNAEPDNASLSPAAERLMGNHREVAQRRQKLDRKLSSLGDASRSGEPGKDPGPGRRTFFA